MDRHTRESTFVYGCFWLSMLAVWVFIVGLGTRSAFALGCSITASCCTAQVECPDNQACVCTATCHSSRGSCSCTCTTGSGGCGSVVPEKLSTEGPPRPCGTVVTLAAEPEPTDRMLQFSVSGPSISVSYLAARVEELFGWRVAYGDARLGKAKISAGAWEGAWPEVLTRIGERSGFKVSLDEQHHTVVLTLP
jgi:hypothetical protein